MDVWEFALTVAVGGGGYLVINFWMRPLLRYADLKHSVTADLVLYANAIRTEGYSELMQEKMLKREQANRENAAELVATYYELPTWYRKVLSLRHESPLEASQMLIGLSNCPDFELAAKYKRALKRHLGINDNLDV